METYIADLFSRYVSCRQNEIQSAPYLRMQFLSRHCLGYTLYVLVDCGAGMYFLFVVLLCAVSLAASIAVMYVHGRSSGTEDSLAMPTWVSHSAGFYC